MSRHRPASGGPGTVRRAHAGRTNPRVLTATIVVLGMVLVAFGITRSRRVAEFAPVTVVESNEPLQELPVRVADRDDAVEPAHTYDAMIDMSDLDALVVGIDLDYVMKGFPRYDAVIRNPEGERFRATIEEDSFREGRFMLRLFADRFPPGDYNLDIEAFDEGATEGRIIATSWFQVSRS